MPGTCRAAGPFRFMPATPLFAAATSFHADFESRMRKARRLTHRLNASWYTSSGTSPPRASGKMHSRLKRSAFSSALMPALSSSEPTASPSTESPAFVDLVSSVQTSASVSEPACADGAALDGSAWITFTRPDQSASTRSALLALSVVVRPRKVSVNEAFPSRIVRSNRSAASTPSRAASATTSGSPTGRLSILARRAAPHRPSLDASSAKFAISIRALLALPAVGLYTREMIAVLPPLTKKSRTA